MPITRKKSPTKKTTTKKTPTKKSRPRRKPQPPKPPFVSLEHAAAELCPQTYAHSTLWRWARHGQMTRDGSVVHLRHFQAGRKLFTQPTWLDEFFREVADKNAQAFEAERSAAKAKPTPKPRSETRRARELAACDTALASRHGLQV